MKVKESELKKLYYSIGEVAEMFEVNTSLIRFWEKEFSVIKPKKNKKGNRLFTTKDIVNFNKIYHLVKIQGHTLDGARKVIKEKGQVYSEKEAVITKLENIKNALLKLKTKQ